MNPIKKILGHDVSLNRVGSVKDILLNVLYDGKIHSFANLVKELHDKYDFNSRPKDAYANWQTEDWCRNRASEELYRLAQKGIIKRPKHGYYQIA